MDGHGFLEQAVIYLAAAVIAVPIAMRLKLGAVLGYLVAGVIIGPWGLALIADVQTILHFSEFGVVLLLFLVGLELEPRKLYAMRWPIFGTGTAQVLLTSALVAGIGIVIGVPWAIAVVAAMGFAMSSTAIALATLEEKKLMATDGGRLSFAVLLFQDLAVIPLMLVLALFTPGERAGLDLANALKALGMIVAIIAAGRYLIRPALRYIASTGQREIFIAFALLLVVGIAFLMQSVGLSPALGTFLAGVLLADSEYRHELELDIEPFKGLLLGLFFIAVGMSIDLGLFLTRPVVIVALVLGVVALKLGLLYALARSTRCGNADGVLFAVALSQVGEFAFVLFAAAGAQKILDQTTLDTLNAVVAGSMLLTPLLFVFYERFVLPRLMRAAPRAPDAIEEANPIIVAGFGRFGQVVTRLLLGLGHRVTVVDHDPNQIELTRQFGFKAYYGDASRLDLLRSAGAATAKLLVVAVDDSDTAERIVTLVRSHFPSLELVVRARGRTEAYALAERNIPHVRETFGAALAASERVLRVLGYGVHTAHRLVKRFGRYDEQLIVDQAKHRNDLQHLIAASSRSREELARLLQTEARGSAPA